ncbi:ccr4 associated factor [Coemansia brasiliensis]|uniref:Ccr4 associated factor n=1 Tax=Coemansia brasiliensis TaxID=2650707 RepID=A0A9W8LWU9_9FUNG|nr:ccr4 associated factor [Coemansia brasiliensis]
MLRSLYRLAKRRPVLLQAQRCLSTQPIRADKPTDFETIFDSRDCKALIEDRGVIEVAGPDSTEFLQGMHCNHMPLISQGGPGMLTGFLTPQGRIIADAFVYPKNMGVNFPHPAYLVEVDRRVIEHIFKILHFYKLRAKVEIRNASEEHQIWSIWGPRSKQLIGGHYTGGRVPRGGMIFKSDEVKQAQIWAVDTRAPGMGLRLVAGRDDQIADEFEQTSLQEYHLRRILKGVGEGADDFVRNVAVPLECNLDFMQGVHFSKGCYVGQELTIRTHHRGVVRKRLVPVLFSTENGYATPKEIDPRWSARVPPLSEVRRVAHDRVRKVTPGRVGSSVGNAGLALMRLEHVDAYVAQQQSGAEEIAFQTSTADGKPIYVSPWSPSWWPNITLN